MSKATVVSVCNYPIGPEFKPGLHPSDYTVPAAESEDNPGVLVIADGFHDIHMLDYKTMRVTVPGEEIARAVVEDYKSAQLQLSPNAAPGVFHVGGEYESGLDAAADFPELYNNAKTFHRNWCNNLVKMADDLWHLKRSHRHIATTMINAALYLKLDREWSRTYKPEQLIACPACASMISSEAAICKVCRTVTNKVAYAELQLAESR